MESRDFVYLQEAYQEIYQLDEEVEIATEYFYEMGLDKEDVEGLIEELGVYGFNDYVCEILEEYDITNISEAAKWQDRLARGVLNAMERDRKAREQFGKTKVGKALSNIGSKAAAGLTAIGDAGEKGISAAEKAIRTSATSKNADENKGTSPSRVTRKHRSHGRVKSGPRPIGRPSSAHSKRGVRPEKPYRTSRETLALPPVGTTKSGKTLTASQRKMQTAAQNRRLAQRLGIDEEFELWVEGLWEEGYDLSDYTWEGLYEAYIEEGMGRHPLALPLAGTTGGSSAYDLEIMSRPERINRNARLRQEIAKRASRRAKASDDAKKGVTEAQESYEAYNTIADYLLDEGYAHDLESADAIIASMSEDWIMDILEARVSYSAKRAAAGKDIGKPGKQFAKIARKAAKQYGSKKRGENVAGAILAKLRKG